MLFSKEYDNSLWLILSSGKFDVESCMDFLKCVPDMLLDLMYQSFKWYQTYKKHPDKGFSGIDEILSRTVKNVDGFMYWYSIDKDSGVLEIGETFDTGEDYFNTSIVKLFPISYDDIHNLGKYEEKMLGEYNYIYHVSHGEDYEHVVLDESMEFTLIKSMFDNYKVETCDILPSHRIRKCLVEVDNMPASITKDDFKIEDKRRKLIRIKNSK